MVSAHQSYVSTKNQLRTIAIALGAMAYSSAQAPIVLEASRETKLLAAVRELTVAPTAILLRTKNCVRSNARTVL